MLAGLGVGINSKFRQSVIEKCSFEVIGITESQLLGVNVIDIPGYSWYGNNRKIISKRARRGLGGVGILVKDTLLSSYSVLSILDSQFEGIL